MDFDFEWKELGHGDKRQVHVHAQFLAANGCPTGTETTAVTLRLIVVVNLFGEVLCS
jgi:hypothetical protein